jgi:cytochrome P450
MVAVCDLYERYSRLREEAPAHRNPMTGIWALSRFDDVRAASRDWETFSNAGGVDLDELGRRVFGPGDFLDTDPPEHDELRAVVRSRFTPKAVKAFEPVVRRHVERLLGGAQANESFDAVEALAWPLPVSVICSLFGFSADQREELGALYRLVMRRTAGEPAIPPAALEAAAEMRRRFVELARSRRIQPDDDLLTQIALAEIDGEPLPDPKLAGLCFVLFSAAIDTVAAVLSNALWLLARHPDQCRVLAEQPAALPVAIEEVLRFESPLQFNARTVTRDVELHDRVIPAGSRVVLLYGAANRDDRRFDHADRFDVSREPKRHLAFGEGIHFCIGAPLARLQAKIALEAVLSAFPGLALAGRAEHAPAYNMRALARLPVRGRD